MARVYNYIYSKLVKDDNDLVGLIAYALYKQHKIEYIESFKADNNNTDPTDKDFESFYVGSCTASSLNSYRDEAQQLLEKLTLAAAREDINEFENEMLRNYKREIADAVKSNQPKWWSSVIYSVIGAFVFSIIIAISSFLGKTSEKANVQLIVDAINSVRTDSTRIETASPAAPITPKSVTKPSPTR